MAVTNGSVALVGGQLVFSPAANYNGPASFSYMVSDGSATATANVNGTVTPVNDAPVANNDSFTVAEDGSVTVDVLANDTDIDGDSLTITQVDGQAITEGGAPVAVTNGSVSLVGGQLVFSPAANYNGPALFSYTVSDGSATATANVTGTVTPVNDAPVANNDSFTVAEDGSVTVDVLANDTDIDGDPLTITQVDGQVIVDGGPAVPVANGSVSLVAGQLVFKPAADYHGPIAFSYTASDGQLSSSAFVGGEVTPVFDAPPAKPQAPVGRTPVVQTPVPVSEPSGPSLEVRPVGVVEGIASSQTPISPLSPEIHVLSAVEGSRVESALVSNGLTIENTNRVLMAEAMTQVADNLLLDQPGDTADLSVALGGGQVQGGIHPEVYVQRAVRHEALTHDHGLFVQRAVRSSILQSRVDDMRIAELSAKFDSLMPWGVERAVEADVPGPSEPRRPENEGGPGSREGLTESQSDKAGKAVDGADVDDAPASPLSEVPAETGADAPVEPAPRAAAKGFRAQLREMALQRNGVVPPLALRVGDAQHRMVGVASGAMRQ
ncbi:MAG: Ig-like domain-containing protein [Burkholderiaceae bacterium]